MKSPNNFAERLIAWYEVNKRDLPWRHTRDPYRIWLSEVILQQTRVEQGMPYYQNFTEHYPAVHDLAEAPEDDILKLWEGLGYYSRARNLLESARYVSKDLNGEFPGDPAGLQELRGIGPYTANAIASFAFNADVAVVDGNVFRFLSRLFGIDTPVNSSEGKRTFQDLADQLLPKGRSASYNQALMEFGALQCKPSPNCSDCPFAGECVALRTGRTGELPVKQKARPKTTRFLNYLFLYNDSTAWLQKRSGNDIWKNLYQFPLLESQEDFIHIDQLLEEFIVPASIDPKSLVIGDYIECKHLLSHRILQIRIWPVRCPQTQIGSLNDGIFEASLKEIASRFALPAVLKRSFSELIEELVS